MIVDTNAVSALLAGEEALSRVVEGVERLHLPVVVVGEYRFGLRRSRAREGLGALLDALIEESVVLPIDLVTTSRYAELREGLRERGTPIPENDVWIAALAAQHGLPIVSRDRHFDRVPEVERVGW